MAKQLFNIAAGQEGFSFNTDLSPYDMPPQLFSDVANARFLDGKAGKILGHSQVLGTPTQPFWATDFLQGSTDLWIYGGLTGLFKITGTTHATVTRSSGAYTTLADTKNNWQGGTLGGVLVVTNALDVPQSLTQAGSVFTDLPNWPSTLRCKAIVPFKNHLVALNLTDNGALKPFTVRWSDAIPSGAASNGTNTWNTGSSASASAETALSDTDGHILNAMQLGNELIIYKQDSIYALNFVGGNFTFNVREKFKDTGLFARDAVVDIGDGRHVLMTTNDVVTHNGNSTASVIDDRVKTFLFRDIDSVFFHKTFLAHNKIKNEVWICYPQTGAVNGFPDRALIWNYRDNTWTLRDLPGVNYIAKGLVNPALANTWTANGSLTWQSVTFKWSERSFNPAIDSLLMCGTNDTLFYLADSGITFNGTAFETRLERRGLHSGRTDAVKAVSAVYPRIEGTGSVNISVGSEIQPFQGVSYSDPVAFEIGVDHKVDCRVRGRFIAIKIESAAATQFNLSGFVIESEVVSTR
tara:strand:- start:1452 stop:3020 length:1569 start_codon:yes stop_codon:yes gene_type:complete